MNTAQKDLKKIYNILFVLFFLGADFWILSRSNIYDLEKSLYQKDALISNFSRIKINLGDRVLHDVLIAKNNWLEYTGEKNLDDFQNLTGVTTTDLQSIEEKLTRLNETLRKQNITLLVVVAPNKASIYPENVPAEIQRVPLPSRLDQFSAQMEKHPEILYLDLRADLIEAKNQELLYYKTDTHWNSRGAYIAYTSVMNALSTVYPDLEPYPLKKFDFVVAQHPTPKDLAKLMSAPFWTENEIRMKFHSNSLPSEKKLMVYGDSFSVALDPFLELHFSQFSYIHWNEKIELEKIQAIRPTIVIIEVVERYLQALDLVLPND